MRLKLALVSLTAAYLSTGVSAQTPRPIDKLTHILVIYLENRSFDNLFGEFPGANGIANAGEAAMQRNRAGETYKSLPTISGPGPFEVTENPAELAAIKSIAGLSNEPFRIDELHKDVTLQTYTRDLTHAFYANQAQINGGKNDRFAAYSDSGALTMGHYSQKAMKNTHLWKLASEFRLLDNFFQGAFGGSFLNHMWLVCSCVPEWPDAPKDARSLAIPDGTIQDDNATVDGKHAVNTTQSEFLNNGKSKPLLPGQNQPTIGDRLSTKGIDWAWYSGGWKLATTRQRTHAEEQEFHDIKFQWHHQPFAYFERFNPARYAGQDERERHLKDATDLVEDIRAGKLPPVAYYKPMGILTQHAGYANVADGDEEVWRIVKLMQESPMWKSSAIIITYDEYGGFFDHVPPPRRADSGARADWAGPGTRVPAILVSPFVQKEVDPTQFDTTSIAKFIAERHQLEPLPGTRFLAVESLSKAFDFSR